MIDRCPRRASGAGAFPAKDRSVDETTGKTLLAWGYRPGSWFAAAIAAAEEARRAGGGEAEIRAAIDRHLPAPSVSLRAAGALAHQLNIAPEDADEIANVKAVEQHMTELMRVPTVRAGAVMPDACPAGAAPGTGKTEAQLVTEQTKCLDVRFFCIPDVSDLPGAYKYAAAVRRQNAHYGLAEIVDEIVPLGCIMAGEWQRNAPWRRGRRPAPPPGDDG
jgi:hypothetical protein